MAIEATQSPAPSAGLRLVPRARPRGPNASDHQKARAHGALSRLLSAGWTCADLAKRLGFESQNLARFYASRRHLGAERCAAVIRLGRELLSPAPASAVPMEPTPPPVAPVSESLTLAAPCVEPAPAGPTFTVTIALTEAQVVALDARLTAFRTALPGVPLSRADVVRGLLETALRVG